MTERIRTIKPEALRDEELWDLEQETGLPLFRAFTGLWCQADKRGRFEWRHRPLKAAVLPYWEGDFSRVLDALATRGFLVRYACDGREYGWIPTFEKHQHINNKEIESRIPEPPKSKVDPKRSRVAHANTTRDERETHAPIPSLPFHSRSIPDPDPDAREGSDEVAATEPEAEPEPVADEQPVATSESPTTQAKAEAYVRDPHTAAMQWGAPDVWPEVKTAFEAFLDEFPKAGTLRARDVRAVLIVERYAEGTTFEQLRDAARGAKRDEFIMSKAELQTVKTIWRDAGQIDKYCALLSAAPPKRKAGTTPVQPSYGVTISSKEYS